tara:strand:+ start:2237 stop:2782 length:546 start_codon:yes stop_codon:yes gene_type:complete
MSNNKTRMSEDRNVISFEKIAKQTPASEPIFSKGLYHWVMFVLGYYSRVKNTLKIDFESFVILQVVVSHHLYELNKEGTKTFNEVETQIINAKRNKSKNKLTFASVSEVLQLPRETVRRKVLSLNKKEILIFNSENGIKLGPAYKTIYKDFVSQSILDLNILVKKWERSGVLKKLLELENN